MHVPLAVVVQLVGLTLPLAVPVTLKLIVWPLMGVALAVSVSVAVQLTGVPTGTDAEAQLSVVVVGRSVAVTTKVPELAA